MGSIDLLAELTARLASTARLDEIADTVLHEIVGLGFGAVWIGVLDELTGQLSTLKDISDGVDVTPVVPEIVTLDLRQPLDHGFRTRQMINITDPGSLHLIERDDEVVPPDKLALSRAVYDRVRGQPFACGPLLDHRREPVGAIALSSYRGGQPIPDSVLSEGLLRAFMNHLSIAIDRALLMARVERLNASLIQAQAAIKTAGELQAAVAHDLNNYSGIGLLAVGVGSRSPADAFEMLAPIERANRAIGDLVARMQRVARLPSSEGQVAHLPQIVSDILIMMRPILGEQSIRVHVDVPAVSPVGCDAVLLHQVLLNLVINARDALREATVDPRQINIHARDDAGWVRLVVTDNGPGIAPEALAHLFQRFTTKGTAHHGLGLASAHASLQQFGGRIEGRNAPTGGAEFEVTLLAAPPSAPEGPVSPRPPPRGARRTRPARILAVDDEPDILDIIRQYLDLLGHTVVLTTDPVQAIAEARSQVFDLVLCDVGMPNHSGFDVCRWLRTAGYRGKLVLMTGWDTEMLRTDGQADMLLKKPFQAPDLLHVIDTLLGEWE